MSYPTSVLKVLDHVSNTINPREAVLALIGMYDDHIDALPDIMQHFADEARVSVDRSVWNNVDNCALALRIMAACCREDMEDFRRTAHITTVDDSDIYDGMGGYKHNSDEPDEGIITEEMQDDPLYGFEATQYETWGEASKRRAKAHEDRSYGVEGNYGNGWRLFRGGLTKRGAKRVATEMTRHSEYHCAKINAHNPEIPAIPQQYRAVKRNSDGTYTAI